MDNNKLTIKWEKKIKRLITILCGAVTVIFIFVAFFIDYSKIEDLVLFCVFVPLIAIGIILLNLFIFRWRVLVDENGFIYRKMFGKEKRYEYKNVIVYYRDNTIEVCHLNGKTIVNIPQIYIENARSIFDEYTKYLKTKMIKREYPKERNRIRGNRIARNFGLFLLIAGIVFGGGIGAAGLILRESISDLVVVIVFIAFMLVVTVTGLVFLLSHYVWKIIIGDDIKVISFWGRKKIYSKSEISYTKSNYAYKIFFKNKKIKTIITYLCENASIVEKLAKNK